MDTRKEQKQKNRTRMNESISLVTGTNETLSFVLLLC